MTLQNNTAGMRGSRLLLALTFLINLSTAAAQEGPSIDLMISRVKREIAAAMQVKIGEPKLELTEVGLEMNTVTTKTAGAEIKVTVPIWKFGGGASGSIQGSKSQKILLTLYPPEKVLLQGSDSIEKLEVAQAIVSIRKQLHAGLAEKPLLMPKELDFEIEFGVQKEVGANAGVKLVFVEAGPNAKYDSKSTQKLTLKFAAPKGPN